eukprot:scaffold334_cov356-Prasinococcus_capsulatus_cf.AAC.1
MIGSTCTRDGRLPHGAAEAQRPQGCERGATSHLQQQQQQPRPGGAHAKRTRVADDDEGEDGVRRPHACKARSLALQPSPPPGRRRTNKPASRPARKRARKQASRQAGLPHPTTGRHVLAPKREQPPGQGPPPRRGGDTSDPREGPRADYSGNRVHCDQNHIEWGSRLHWVATQAFLGSYGLAAT